MMRFVRSAFVIARRDFSATVLSKTFIFFLLGPLFPLLFGGVFGSIGARVAQQTERPVVAVVAPQADYSRLAAARAQLAEAVGLRVPGAFHLSMGFIPDLQEMNEAAAPPMTSPTRPTKSPKKKSSVAATLTTETNAVGR